MGRSFKHWAFGAKCLCEISHVSRVVQSLITFPVPWLRTCPVYGEGTSSPGLIFSPWLPACHLWMFSVFHIHPKNRVSSSSSVALLHFQPIICETRNVSVMGVPHTRVRVFKWRSGLHLQVDELLGEWFYKMPFKCPRSFFTPSPVGWGRSIVV